MQLVVSVGHRPCPPNSPSQLSSVCSKSCHLHQFYAELSEVDAKGGFPWDYPNFAEVSAKLLIGYPHSDDVMDYPYSGELPVQVDSSSDVCASSFRCC